ncbi:MAG: hypothetical protein ABIG20_03200 [archaeon]
MGVYNQAALEQLKKELDVSAAPKGDTSDDAQVAPVRGFSYAYLAQGADLIKMENFKPTSDQLKFIFFQMELFVNHVAPRLKKVNFNEVNVESGLYEAIINYTIIAPELQEIFEMYRLDTIDKQGIRKLYRVLLTMTVIARTRATLLFFVKLGLELVGKSKNGLVSEEDILKKAGSYKRFDGEITLSEIYGVNRDILCRYHNRMFNRLTEAQLEQYATKFVSLNSKPK